MNAVALRRASLACVAAVAVLSSCTGVAQKGAAEGAVNHFHTQLDAASYDAIYDDADDAFKQATKREEFTRVLKAIHDKLGAVTSTKQTSFFSQDQVGTNSGSFLKLVYETQFASGTGTETFTWRVDGGQVRLRAYDIKSTDLLTK